MSNTEIHDEDTLIANCVFCNIVNGKIPSVKLFENEETLAFLDINPNTRGHTLVIPKAHHENIYGLPAETLARTMLTVQHVAIALKNELNADGINIVMNNESAAGQLIWHAHVHIIPRTNEDNGYVGQKYTYIAGEMEEIAEQIKGTLIL